MSPADLPDDIFDDIPDMSDMPTDPAELIAWQQAEARRKAEEAARKKGNKR